MKLDENKHDHKLTNWLKVGIFALLMIAPLFASITQTMYATFNKNAYQSYSDNYIQSTQNINNSTQIINQQNYIVSYYDSTVANYNDVIYIYNSISIDWTTYGASNQYNYVGFMFNTYHSPNNRIFLYYYENDTLSRTSIEVWGNALKTFNFNLKETQSLTQFKENQVDRNYTLYMLSYKQDTLDNAFYYGVEKMTESDLFNWTQNTALYTGINAMTTQLEIQTPAIAILLTYWFILTIIYVIIDIVLKGFTLLTHMFSNKV